jgi:tRNA G18 (ribose-2'-O)-methylase SpoU
MARVTRIEDGRDPRLADYAGVREPALLRERGLLIAEGRFVVRRLLGSTRIRSRSLLLNDAALTGLSDILDSADLSLDVYVASPAVIEAATGFNMHHGCLALAERPAEVSMEAVLSTSQFVLVLERVVDADNVGSVFRSAEAFGVDAVLLSPGCCDPFYRKAIRTSSGAALVVPCAAAEPWPDALNQLRANGFAIAAMTPDGEAMDIGAFVGTPAARGRIAVLLGTEGHGLTAEALARADVRLRIPMSGARLEWLADGGSVPPVLPRDLAHYRSGALLEVGLAARSPHLPTALDSLNIATAAGIALHRLHEVRQRRGGPT